MLIQEHDLDMIYVVSQGHGAPSILANLWLEDTLESFSTTGGFLSHLNAEAPGAIHEVREFRYALLGSFGAVMDKPDLIVTCIVGDGEAETGPTATAWQRLQVHRPSRVRCGVTNFARQTSR
jgi:xylulose-5-phosphate/fructose-6-phosphate phosphoketolase